MKSVMVMTDGGTIMYSPTVYIEHVLCRDDDGVYIFEVHNTGKRTHTRASIALPMHIAMH